MEAKDFIDTFKGALFKNLTKPIDNWGENFNQNLILEFAFENRLFKLVLQILFEKPTENVQSWPKEFSQGI